MCNFRIENAVLSKHLDISTVTLEEITKNAELPVIRGGFKDQYGNIYSEGLTDDSLGPVNIQVKEINSRPKLS
jgi:hypothetical protein